MKRVLIVSPHFVPSNLAGVHRARIMSSDLPAFGWEPTILAVDPKYYEEPADPSGTILRPQGTALELVKALPSSLCRPIGIGDIAIRAQWSMRKAARRLTLQKHFDLVFCTVLPGLTSLVGRWAKRKLNLPFALDYQDPWVSNWGSRQPRLSKAGLSHRLARLLEPKIVQSADAISAVSPGTLTTLRERGLLSPRLPVAYVPIGANAADHRLAAEYGSSWIRRKEGEFIVSYIGTVTKVMLPVIAAVFKAVAESRHGPEQLPIKLHFFGTSAQPDGRDVYELSRMASAYGLSDAFRLEPRRLNYLDALRTMQKVDALLLIGSTEPHYTASKIFPSWLAAKPILAVFHQASTVNEIARELGGISLVNYGTDIDHSLLAAQLVSALASLHNNGTTILKGRSNQAFEPYSSRGVARSFANLFNQTLASAC